jgi:tetratricopeptide (TPR) repeat protein
MKVQTMKNESNQSRTIKEYFQKGVSALEKKNYDYAIEMLLQVVQEDPFFFEARQELHRAEHEKRINNPPSLVSLFLIKINNAIPYMMALYYEASKDYEKAIAFYEDLLRYDLGNKRYLNKIYALALKSAWTDVAIVALESLFMLDNKNAEISQNLGRLYRDKEEIKKASFYFKKALELDPHNQKISKSLKDLEALHTIQAGGWDQASGYRSILKDENSAVSLEKESILLNKGLVSDETIQKMEHTVIENPNDPLIWSNLINFYLETDLLKKAHETIVTAQKKFPDSERIKESVSQYNKQFYTAELKRLKEALRSKPNDTEITKKIADYEINLAKVSVSILKKKTEFYPNDLSLKYELGEAEYNLKMYDEAISEFQQAVKDPALSIKALNKLGLSFHAKKMFDLAVLQFNKALEKVPGINETSKDIIYNLGTSFESMGKRDEALTQFKKIYEADISYRDVAHKIEKFYSK